MSLLIQQHRVVHARESINTSGSLVIYQSIFTYTYKSKLPADP